MTTCNRETWIGAETWAKGAALFAVDELHGLPAWVGLDGSKAVAIVVAVPKDGVLHLISYRLAPRTDAMGWDAWLLPVQQIMALINNRFDVKGLAFDRWLPAFIVQQLKEMKLPLVEHGQGYAAMSLPMKAFESAAYEGVLRHGGDNDLAQAVANCCRAEDGAGHIKPDKARSFGEIELAVAAIMAVGLVDRHNQRALVA